MFKQLKKDIRGFSMVEIIAVIVILGIIAGVGIPAALNYIKKSRQDSFFESVSEVVETVSEANSLNGASYCVYDDHSTLRAEVETKGNTGSTDDIENIYIYTWVNSSGKKLYAVYATSKETGAIIDTTDFYSLSMKNKNQWNTNNAYSDNLDAILDLDVSSDTIQGYINDLAKCDLGGTR